MLCGQLVGLLTDVCTEGNPTLNQSLSSPSSQACAGCEGCGETKARRICSCDPCDDPGVGQRPWGPQEMCGPSGSLGEALVWRLAPPSAHPSAMQTPGIPCPVSPAPPSTSQVLKPLYSNLVLHILFEYHILNSHQNLGRLNGHPYLEKRHKGLMVKKEVRIKI